LALGADHAMVVHSYDGLDEISISAPTHVCEVIDGEIRDYILDPEELGVERAPIEAIAGGDSTENARIARAVLSGESNGPCRDIVAVNAGAALYVSGAVPTLRDGVALATDTIASGAAMRKLEELASATKELA
ncbi:MAG TPA: anthranilate phosphoribosyltransferase, partial [Thermoanaerobaculia bacterium]|nr:anthranilate phosphoribosyltransferase [Thermoanaerobaculia bacterium]